MFHPEALEPIVNFVREIGFDVQYGAGAAGGFLPGVNIYSGALHIDPSTLMGPGDILHEAGHIIVVPRRYWSRMQTDLQTSVDLLAAEELAPDGRPNPLLTHAKQMGEFMAQAWSYAVALHLGLSPGCIFFPGAHHIKDYEDVHPMQQWIERGTHYGPQALADVGMTGYSGVFGFMHDNGLPPFPRMARWTLD